MFKNRVTGLTEKQEAFCVEVVTSPNNNLADSYRNAYGVQNASPKVVGTRASLLLRQPKIQARIADLRANAVKKTELSIDKVLDEVCCIAFLDPITAYDAEGNLLPLSDMPENTRRAIRSIEVFQNGRVNVKFFDKVQALERLMRFLGMFEKDNAQQARNLFDNLTRPQLKELEAVLIELAREDAIETPPDGDGGKTH